MSDIIAAMGRLKIKKKETVIPFRETIAYRLLLVTACFVALLFALYYVAGDLSAGNPSGLLVSGAAAALCGGALLFNLSRMRDARVPQRTMKKMRRRV